MLIAFFEILKLIVIYNTASSAEISSSFFFLALPLMFSGICALVVGVAVLSWPSSEMKKNKEMQESARKMREMEAARIRAEKEGREAEAIKQTGLKTAEDLMKAGRYEEAAQLFERWGDLEKAGECRRLNRTTYVVSANVHFGKDGGISIDCPHCGGSQPIESKGTNEVTCKYCGKKYIIPKKVLDLL